MRCSGATRREEESAPLLLLLLLMFDLPPRREKGFPSGPWPPLRRRCESPCEIGSLSVFPSVSTLPDSALSPFLKFPETRNSDWVEILTRFLSGYWLSCGERRAPTVLRSGPEGRGRAPHPRGPLGHRLALIPLPKIHLYSKKKSPSVFILFGLCLIWIFYETKDMQQTGTGTGHWINMLVLKIV